jgi:hypothetical protein
VINSTFTFFLNALIAELWNKIVNMRNQISSFLEEVHQ